MNHSLINSFRNVYNVSFESSNSIIKEDWNLWIDAGKNGEEREYRGCHEEGDGRR
ncbi:hypothetical protein ACSBR1_001726 [Camellia fascicularis]